MARSRSNTKNPSKTSAQLRIIGGKHRGRKLPIIEADGLRPTGDRIRETLFNWLAPDIAGARCLDLFAGAGSLGLEALSRGAGFCQMIDMNAQAASQLKTNLGTLKEISAQVDCANSLEWLSQTQAEGFDLVFIDPPFANNLWQQAVEQLASSALLNPNACIYVESPRATSVSVPENWQLHREKSAGQVTYRLYYLQS